MSGARLSVTQQPGMKRRPGALLTGMTFTSADDSALLTLIALGAVTAANRLFMAPLTRSRAAADGTPTDLQAQYYAQRASAG